MAEAAPESKAGTALGLTVETLTADAAKAAGYEGEKGVLVSQVDEDSSAAQAHIQPGDLVTEVNRVSVASVAEFQTALAKSKDQGPVLLFVKRKGEGRFVILRPK